MASKSISLKQSRNSQKMRKWKNWSWKFDVNWWNWVRVVEKWGLKTISPKIWLNSRVQILKERINSKKLIDWLIDGIYFDSIKSRSDHGKHAKLRHTFALKFDFDFLKKPSPTSPVDTDHQRKPNHETEKWRSNLAIRGAIGAIHRVLLSLPVPLQWHGFGVVVPFRIEFNRISQQIVAAGHGFDNVLQDSIGESTAGAQ